MTMLVILAVLCVLLGSYIVWLLRDDSRRLHRYRSARQDRIQRHRRDLSVLLRCLDEQQVEPAEACLRVKLILNAMQNLGDETPEHQVFERMYLELADHPVGEARNGLQKQERMQWDLKRWEVEGRYRDALMEEGRQLLGWLQGSGAVQTLGEAGR